jgi:hypothetical protein
VNPGRLSRFGRAVLLAVLPGVLAAGCLRSEDARPAAAPARDLPASSAQLGALMVTTVPSGLPRLPDRELDPPAGAKRLEDIARYSADPADQGDVLRGYGYRYGWERFWGTSSGPMTGVFVDQFQGRAGAAAYAEDLARNDARHYRGMLRENPPQLPGGCRMLTVDRAEPDAGLRGPASFAWCAHGVFSVSVTAVARTVAAADAEVRAVLASQLRRLPPR